MLLKIGQLRLLTLFWISALKVTMEQSSNCHSAGWSPNGNANTYAALKRDASTRLPPTAVAEELAAAS